MKILIDHFNSTMNQTFEFRTWFNSHHRNVLKVCNLNQWSDLLPIYEAVNSTGFIRYAHRVQIIVGDRIITIPKKLSNRIHSSISTYFILKSTQKNLKTY